MSINYNHHEYSVVSINEIKNQYTVNYSVVNSKAMHNNFENLTGCKAVDEALYKKAAEILNHRNGTPYEDIAMLDARTGNLLVENKTAADQRIFSCGLSKQETEKLLSLRKEFEILHNHPSNSIPSTSDIAGLFKRKLAVGSTIICHNGSVYRLEKLKQYDAINELIEQIYDEINTYKDLTKYLQEVKASALTIEKLRRNGYIKYEERRVK